MARGSRWPFSAGSSGPPSRSTVLSIVSCLPSTWQCGTSVTSLRGGTLQPSQTTSHSRSLSPRCPTLGQLGSSATSLQYQSTPPASSTSQERATLWPTHCLVPSSTPYTTRSPGWISRPWPRLRERTRRRQHTARPHRGWCSKTSGSARRTPRSYATSPRGNQDPSSPLPSAGRFSMAYTACCTPPFEPPGSSLPTDMCGMASASKLAVEQGPANLAKWPRFNDTSGPRCKPSRCHTGVSTTSTSILWARYHQHRATPTSLRWSTGLPDGQKQSR